MATAIAIGALFALPAPAANAAAPCTVTAHLPVRISIDRPDETVPVVLSGCEGRFGNAGVSLDGPVGSIDYLEWEGTRTTVAHVYDFVVAPGTFVTADGTGQDSAGNDIAWHYTTTTLRFGTTTEITATRPSATTTSLTVLTRRYATFYGFVGYPYHVVGIQTASTAGGPWRSFAYAKVGAGSRATVVLPAPSGQYYRAFFGDGPNFFGSISMVVRA